MARLSANVTVERWPDMVEGAVALRRDLHRRPELAWTETETARTIRNELSKAGIPWRACAGTGTVASLASGASGRHVALRADIDAMPIQEATGAAWASQHEGLMHACGHDGHTAALVAAAWWLKSHEDELPGPVTLLFQPAEEGGHASQPEACRDPVLAASAITMSLQQVVSRRVPAQHSAVVSVTSIDAPSAETVIPDGAYVAGSVRMGDTAQREVVFDLITRVAQDTARAYGVTAEVELRPRYGATINDPDEADRLRQALGDELGPTWRSERTLLPVMASEDFSYYLSEVPGAFALIGADDGGGHAIPCHSPRYDFNDRLIPHVTRVFARMAGAPVPP